MEGNESSGKRPCQAGEIAVPDKAKRNRAKPIGTLEERLEKFAEDAMAAARAAPEGKERDMLIAKAKKAELAATAAGRLRV